MKNVIKKTCAIVMMTAILFTTVAPRPVSAACGHPKTIVSTVYDTKGSSHVVNSMNCTIIITYTYRLVSCANCGRELVKTLINTEVRHTAPH